ncbi:squalene/phytoene synthase family protein [Tropicimonas sp. IMCC34043]|uniref:squalene/phytoene synthase family protein n=1 Tax=Tropicimonas sp. IMCC34043 TaxID=2248760 RepID=UPI000E237477|nr:squalene/phytoene synthase family protein [Tropicimonas sp. IMCC34043]
MPDDTDDRRIAACAEIVARGDPDRFLATMAAPIPARAVLFPVFAFNIEVTRAPWVSQEPLICEMRLQFWRDVLTEISEGVPPRAHEVAAPLATVLRGRPDAIAALDALIEARRHDILPERFPDTAELSAYLEATAAGLMWAAARVLGVGPEGEAAIRAVGWAGGLAAYLRAVPALTARGYPALPDQAPEAVAALARTGLARLAEARRAGPPAAAVPALRTAWRAKATLTRAAARPADVAAGSLDESEFQRRAGLLRRSWLGDW